MSETARTWKTILSEKMADCRIFEVRRDVCVDAETEDHEATFYCIESPDWCNVIPLTANGEVVLIEQFRHGIQKTTLEIPGGIVDEGEDAKAAATRELLEETGYTPREVISLGMAHPNPAIQNNKVHFFLAKGCEKTQEPNFDATEHAVTKLVALNEIKNLIESEQITHSLVLDSFLRFFLKENELAK
ncbi:MAG: NUDIX hydrolase [Pyrinomonadaceae bacterium]